MDSFTGADENDKGQNDLGNNLFFSNLINTFPNLESIPTRRNGHNLNGNSLFSNILDSFNGSRGSFSNFSSNIDQSNPIDIFSNAGPNPRGLNISPSTSPHTNSSSGSSTSTGNFCGRCDSVGANRCLDCNDIFCSECINEHLMNAFTKQHTVVGLGKITPIGSVSNSNSILHNANLPAHKEPQCEIHMEALRFLCETCKKIVCQECTMKDHKDHEQLPIANITAEMAREKLKAIHESAKMGSRFIKTSIDKAITFSQNVECESLDISSRIKKAFRLLTVTAEDREKILIEQVEKYRQQKTTLLSHQMTGLRTALAGLAKTSECITKSIENLGNSPQIDIALLLADTESSIERYAGMYKNLQPREENLNFVPLNFEVLQSIRSQGEVVINSKNGNGVGSAPQLPPSAAHCQQPGAASFPSNNDPHMWDSATENACAAVNPVVKPQTYASIVKPNGNAAPIVSQCIPGSVGKISFKPGRGPSLTFCVDGQKNGQVSRPWGCCVNAKNEIIVADRRNNRIQVFNADGTFKFKFGSKGTKNGEFDLPAGVATDQKHRIIVVDKDNHRIQIFSACGDFMITFGEYGKEVGHFMYPWAVAVNTKSQILVTDSRNHRIQLFNPDGVFISKFSLDGVNHSRFLKGLTTPRGVAFTPQGNIIVSDFENHRLILIDSSMTEILATKGREGAALHEFSRPSGICCDDDGRIIVADSKNLRVLVFSPMLDLLWNIEIRTSAPSSTRMDEKDRPSDVALLNDGRLVVLVEISPDSRDVINPQKTFVRVY